MKATVREKGLSKRFAILWGAMAVALCLFAFPRTALAIGTCAGELSITKLKGTVTMYTPGTVGNNSFFFYRFTHKAGQLKNVKSSNENALFVWGTEGNRTLLYTDKPGKSTVTYTYKGKKYKAKVVVKKYQNPVKSVTIGKKTYSKPFKSFWEYSVKRKALNGKTIKVTPAKGWKVVSISYTYRKNGKFKKVSNGGKLTNMSKYPSVVITMMNKQTGGYESVYFLGEE